MAATQVNIWQQHRTPEGPGGGTVTACGALKALNGTSIDAFFFLKQARYIGDLRVLYVH